MEDVNAFSIATFRERDKAIQRKHSEEIHRYKVALDKSNYVNAGLRTSLFDLKNRSNRLVQSLGFGDLMEAQVYVDAEQSEIKYRDLLRLVESLEGKLKESKALIAKMENKEKELEEKYTVIRKTKDESVYAHRLLVKEHQNLQDMHNDTVKSNNAAAERRQKDYEKWTHFKRWILCLAEIEQFKKYEKELGLDKVERKERAKELFRAVTRKKYKLSQLDSLQDETLFDLVEQDSNESRLFATAPNIRILDNASKPSPITPLNPSSKANNPANDHNPSSSPFLDPNTAAIQPQRLIRSYAIKNTTTSPPMMVESDLTHDTGLPTLDLAVAKEDDRNEKGPASILSVTVLPDEGTSSPPPALVVPAPDSETEDESQSLRWSQFPPHALITAPIIDRSQTPTLSSNLVNPSTARVVPPEQRPNDNPVGHSRLVTSPPSPINDSNAGSPLPLYLRASSPKLASSRMNTNTKAFRSSTQAEPYCRPQRYPLSPTPMYRARRPLSYVLPGMKDDAGLEEQRFDEVPPNKYRKSAEGHRIPSGSGNAAKTDDRSRRKSAPSALSFDEEEYTSPGPSTTRYGFSGSMTGRKRNDSRARGKEKEKDDDYKENDGTIVVDSARHSHSHSERRKSAGDRALSGMEKRKGKEKERNDVSSASRPTQKGSLDDYSIYKGRGRYGKDKDRGEGDATINEMYEIDPAQNAGLKYQYDEVVRGREKRKRLIGGDCDDCREYYEAIGPMPPRLQPPLWKSPVKDSRHPGSASRSCPHHQHGGKQNYNTEADADESIFDGFDSPPSKLDRTSRGNTNENERNTRSTSTSAIAAHKQGISRHRAAWARGNTPPAYWDIGFPDTQIAEEINERAREMQRRKKEMVEREATREGGRYRRK